MKKLKIWSILMLVAMTLPMMVACGSDSDDGGGGISYTEAEILDILVGTWEVYGEAKIDVESDVISYSKNHAKYKGRLEFKSDQTIKYTMIEGGEIEYIENAYGNPYTYYIDKSIFSSYHKYKIHK